MKKKENKGLPQETINELVVGLMEGNVQAVIKFLKEHRDTAYTCYKCLKPIREKLISLISEAEGSFQKYNLHYKCYNEILESFHLD